VNSRLKKKLDPTEKEGTRIAGHRRQGLQPGDILVRWREKRKSRWSKWIDCLIRREEGYSRRLWGK